MMVKGTMVTVMPKRPIFLDIFDIYPVFMSGLTSVARKLNGNELSREMISKQAKYFITLYMLNNFAFFFVFCCIFFMKFGVYFWAVFIETWSHSMAVFLDETWCVHLAVIIDEIWCVILGCIKFIET